MDDDTGRVEHRAQAGGPRGEGGQGRTDHCVGSDLTGPYAFLRDAHGGPHGISTES